MPIKEETRTVQDDHGKQMKLIDFSIAEKVISDLVGPAEETHKDKKPTVG